MESKESEIREEMMKLWSDTFHDSDEYIKLVFDTYFNRDNVEICTDETGHIISSLLSVPYSFYSNRYCENECKNTKMLKGLYLCGLATEKTYRGKGIMYRLMLEIEKRALENDFDFTFLIPASEVLRRYYRQKGYHSLSGKVECVIDFGIVGRQQLGSIIKFTYNRDELNYTLSVEGNSFEILENGVEKFKVCKLNITEDEFERFSQENMPLSIERFDVSGCFGDDESEDSEKWCADQEKLAMLHACHVFLCEKEEADSPLAISHTWHDFIAAVRENNISGGKIVVLQNCDCKPFAIIFCYNGVEENTIDIRFAASRSEDCLALLLLYLKLCCFRDASKAVISLPAYSRDGSRTINRFFSGRLLSADGESVLTISVRPNTFRSVPYGMIKWLKSPIRLMNVNIDRENIPICNSQRVEDLDNIAICQDEIANVGRSEVGKQNSESDVNEMILNSKMKELRGKRSENFKCNQHVQSRGDIPENEMSHLCLNISLMLD